MRAAMVAAASLFAAVAIALGLGSCSNPDAPGSEGSGAQNAGEPPAPSPRAAASEGAWGVQPTPVRALEAFGRRYINWSWQTLSEDQRALAAMAVGQARLAEQQARAGTRGDHTLARAQVFNRGDVVAVAPDARRDGWWAIVTREQTGGQGYEGLGASYHVTLARPVRVRDGWAVEEWLPQQ